MKIRINPLTPIMLIAVTLTGNIKLYLLAYLVMTLHETAHLVAALFIGLKPQSITFSPFGVHLRLDCKIINTVSEEIILYSAGPLVNAIFALFTSVNGMTDLYRLNTVLFVLNILPIVPLDGGMIMLRILSYHFGNRLSKRILNTFSVCIGMIALCASCYSIYRGYINISLFIISVLFIGNILTSKEMYNTDFINAISCRKKHTNRAKLIVLDKEHSILNAVQNFSTSYTTIGVVIDDEGKVSKILSEKEILDSVDGYSKLC